MKRMRTVFALLAVAAALLLSPFHSRDAEKLIPVQTLCVHVEEGVWIVGTDGGLFGRGADPGSALADLERTAPGILTLSTARQIVVSGVEAGLEELVFSEALHPGTEVYDSAAPVDAGDVTPFLDRHADGISISRLRAAFLTGEPVRLPRIEGDGGRYRICETA